jgi:FAD:protein FMN transferase
MNTKRLWRVVFLFITWAGACQSAEPKRFEFESKHMGTLFKIVVYSESPETASKATKAAFERVAELDRVLSDYNAKSELNQLLKANETKPGEALPISSDFINAVKASQRVSKLTDGYFDITVGPVVRLWRLARRTQQLPDPQELNAALNLVGYEKIQLDEQAKTITLKQPGMRLDFGGIGKGFAADEALKVLKIHGLNQALVAASGDVTCGDAPPGQSGWLVEILPLTRSQPARFLRLANRSVSTSGDLDNFVEIHGIRYSHVLNVKTGIGLTGRRSVTVISQSGAQTDALTKGASAMPQEQAVKLIESLEQTAAFWAIQEQGQNEVKEYRSQRFDSYLEKK